jgi:hypothetical protein
VLAALSTANKIGLGLSGLTFVIYALISSMVVPRSNPDYPGRRLGVFVVVTFLIFVGMLAAVLVFGVEEPEPEGGEGAAISYVAN